MAPVDSTLRLYVRLFRETRDCLPLLGLLLLLHLISTPLVLLSPVPLAIAVDSAIGSEPLPGYLRAVVPASWSASSASIALIAVGLLVVLAVLTQLQVLSSSWMHTYVAERVTLGFRARLYRRIQKLSLAYHDTTGTADSVYRVQYDAASIQYIVIDGAIPFITAMATVVSMLYVTYRVNARLALVAFAVAPVLLVLGPIYRRRLRREAHRVKQIETSVLSLLQETLGGIRVVQAYGQESREADRFVSRHREGTRARLGLALSGASLGLLVGMTTAVGMAAALLVGVNQVRSGGLTVGSLLLVMGYLARFYDPLGTISKKFASLQSHLASAERALTLIDASPDIADRPGARAIRRATGAIAFRGVSFSYEPGHEVLDDVTVEIPAHSRVGIVGPSGTGKTTLVSLLLRFYDPGRGCILLDGTDLRDYRLADLRDQFSLVLQDPILFSASVRENIAYARPGATDAEIVAAAKSANAHEFIRNLPEGYDTLVGERGARLSGGERQRIALARAFLKDAPILLLDEPTSSVDLTTEDGILEALDRLMAGRTTLLIAHRHATLRSCDRVLQIEGGRVTPSRSPVSDAAARARAGATGDPDHPALLAWNRLSGETIRPRRIEILQDKARSSVYRIVPEGGGRPLIAKRSRLARAIRERLVYERILPQIDLPAPACFGFIEAEPCADREATDRSGWLFIEDVGSTLFDPFRPDHRTLAARWLASFHRSAADLPPDLTRDFSDRTLPKHRGHLDSGRAAASDLLARQGSGDGRDVIGRVVDVFDAVESRWRDFEEMVARFPRALVHGDCVPRNLHLAAGPGGPALVPIDWGSAGIGLPGADLGQTCLLWTGPRPDPDHATYHDLAIDRWPSLVRDDVRRMAALGRVFSSLYVIDMALVKLGDPRENRIRHLSNVALYAGVLRDSTYEAL